MEKKIKKVWFCTDINYLHHVHSVSRKKTFANFQKVVKNIILIITHYTQNNLLFNSCSHYDNVNKIIKEDYLLFHILTLLENDSELNILTSYCSAMQHKNMFVDNMHYMEGGYCLLDLWQLCWKRPDSLKTSHRKERLGMG